MNAWKAPNILSLVLASPLFQYDMTALWHLRAMEVVNKIDEILSQIFHGFYKWK